MIARRAVSSPVPVTAHVSALRKATRALVFFSLLLWTWGGPFAKQVVGKKWPYAQHWVMFSGASLDICAVRFTEKLEDGTQRAVDRWEVQGKNPWELSRGQRMIRTAAEATTLGKRLCRSLPDGTDLRVYSRCATRTGWKREAKGEINVCAK